MNFNSIDHKLLSVLFVAIVALLGAAVMDASALHAPWADAVASTAKAQTPDPLVASAPTQTALAR